MRSRRRVRKGLAGEVTATRPPLCQMYEKQRHAHVLLAGQVTGVLMICTHGILIMPPLIGPSGSRAESGLR